MRRGRAKSRPGAFTLVEVLVGLAIFALAAVVLGTAYVNVLANFHLMRRGGEARSEIAVLRSRILTEPDLRRAREGGEMLLRAGGRLRWTVAVDETEVADLFRVTVATEVTGDTPADRPPQAQEFLVLRPTWSDPAKRERLRAAARERLQRHRS